MPHSDDMMIYDSHILIKVFHVEMKKVFENICVKFVFLKYNP